LSDQPYSIDEVEAGGSSPIRPPAPRWADALRTAYRDPAELARALDLPERWAEQARVAASRFPLFAPRGFVRRMRRADPHDPLLRQVMPLEAETHTSAGFEADPVGDAPAMLSPGWLQKYAGRVLLVATGACAIHCRYCFRRHFPYPEVPRSVAQWELGLAQIAADPSVREVILSGGDPLTLVDRLLAELTARVASIGHVRRLRIHSRLPIVIPERIDDALLAWLTGTRLAPVMVVHVNHPQEIDATVEAALARLVEAGVPVLNQAVLLRGINDDVDVLAELCERLADLRVMSYYLHQLDRVAGAAHFEVPESEGLRLIEALRGRLPGYAVPRYVRETPGERSKLPLA